jgi:HAD superfamily hydrolase (TIGR01509 family)
MTGAPHGRLALFDLDDTLLDREERFRRWASKVADRHGLGPQAADLLCALDDHGRTGRSAMFAAFARSFPALSAAWLAESYRADRLAHSRLEPRLAARLRRLRSLGFRLGVVTNGPISQAEKIAAAGLPDLVDGWVVSAAVEVEKPDPQIFELAVSRLGDGQGSAWMVGDDPVADIAGAHAAGLSCAWVGRGRSYPAGLPAPNLIVGTTAEAADRLAAIVTRGVVHA